MATARDRRIRLPQNAPDRIDLVRVLRANPSAAAMVWLRRRGQAHPLTWKRMRRYVDRWIPTVRIHHSWPSERFGVTTRGKSRMR